MIDLIINQINSSKLVGGLFMFIMNIGSKYISQEIPDDLDKYFNKYKFLRYIVVFSIAFIATRDIKMSLILLLLFIILFKHLFKPESKSCILPVEGEEDAFGIDVKALMAAKGKGPTKYISIATSDEYKSRIVIDITDIDITDIKH